MTCPKCGAPVEDPGLCTACWDGVRDVDGAIRKATRNREIVAKLAAGADVDDLAREYRISRRSIFRIREAATRSHGCQDCGISLSNIKARRCTTCRGNLQRGDNARIVAELYREHPAAPLTEVARSLGISRERVRQLREAATA